MTDVTRREILESASSGTLVAGLSPAFAGTSVADQAAPAAWRSPRTRHLLDFGWKFALGHAADVSKDFGFGAHQRAFAKQGMRVADAASAEYDDTSWADVQVPHDWAIDLPFTPSSGVVPEWDPRADHGFKPIGREFPATSIGWYRKRFVLGPDDIGRRISLEFDGVFRDALVMLNGYVVAQNASGYAPFRADITDFANYDGPNVLVVRVDASHGEGWFYEGAGIYRHVWLVKTAPVYLPQWGLFVSPKVKGTDAELQITAEVANDSAAEIRVQVISEVIDAAGAVVAKTSSSVRVESGVMAVVEMRGRIPKAQRWSIERPYLYRLRTTLSVGGSIVDGDEVTFGVRTIHFDPERGFFLNGEHVKLLGTCNHQDHAGVGAALPDALQAFRIARLKEMGSNAYRAAHNPPTPELLDACDRLGMLVIDETRAMSSSPEAISQLERLVRRDRNHPCVIMWSICNEEQAHQGTPRGERIGSSMRRAVLALDDSRPLTAALDQGWGEGVSKVVEVLGFNYRTDQMEDYHRRVPTQSLIGSETASTVCTRGEYVRDDVRHILPAYDREHPWWATTSAFWWKIVDARPYIAGGFIWTGFDYRGEPTPFNQFPSISSYFGVFDTCGFPKDNYYYYRAWWRPDLPQLHLLPHWNWPDKIGQDIEVWVHTNLDEVELLVNGVSVGRKSVTKNEHVAWFVPYAPGRIEAIGYRAGAVVQTARRVTAGPPARLVVTADSTVLHADAEDCAVIAVEVVDAAGVPVPTANNLVSFKTGAGLRVIGVGNGNPTSLEADRADKRRAFNGLCAAIVQAGDRPGMVEVTASAPGLASGTVTIDLRSARRRAFA